MEGGIVIAIESGFGIGDWGFGIRKNGDAADRHWLERLLRSARPVLVGDVESGGVKPGA